MFRGVENKPWARYTGDDATLRVLIAWLSRRKQGANPPLPPILPAVIALAALLIVLASLAAVVMWLFGGG